MDGYLAIAVIVSVYTIMKITERIIKDYSHKKTIEVKDFEAESARFVESMKVGQQNFDAIVEEIRDIKAEMQELKDLQFTAPPLGGRRS